MTDRAPRPTPTRIVAARNLRAKSTLSEALLWRALRGRAVGGMKFRRQHPLGPFFLDFFCEAARLAVEVDGSAHDPAPARRYDIERQRQIEEASIRVLRVRAEDVEKRLDAVLIAIEAALTPGPSPTAGGRGE